MAGRARRAREGRRAVIIAIEGVSCTGKSTLAARLATRLGWQTIECYYHVANDRRRAYCKPH